MGLAAAAAPPPSVNHAAMVAYARMLFLKGDIAGSDRLYVDPMMIQHNPEIEDGLAGREKFFAAKAAHGGGAPTDWANVNDAVLIDGDELAVVHHMFRGPRDPGRVFFDLWRFANGKVVEHWDLIEALPEAGALAPLCGLGDDYASARAVVLSGRDTLAHPGCGRAGDWAHRARSLAALAPVLRAQEQDGAILARVLAEGDMVLLHSHRLATRD